MDAHYWWEKRFSIISQKLVCTCLRLVSCSSQIVQWLWLLSNPWTRANSHLGPNGVRLFPFACCNMLQHMPASYENWATKGWFVYWSQPGLPWGYMPRLSARELLQRHIIQTAPNRCDGQYSTNKQNYKVLLLSCCMIVLPVQAVNNNEIDIKIGWFLSLQGHIFKFLYTTKTTRKNLFYSENNYFQSSKNFRPSEAEMCILLISLNKVQMQKAGNTDLLIQESLIN